MGVKMKLLRNICLIAVMCFAVGACGEETSSDGNPESKFRLIAQYRYDSTGKLLYTWNITYDSEGRHIVNGIPAVYEGNLFKKEGSDSSFTVYNYNTSDLLEKVEKYVNGKLVRYFEIKYNDDGKRIKQECFTITEEETNRTYSIYKYDSKGRRISAEKFNDEDVMIATVQYLYDSNGCLSEILGDDLDKPSNSIKSKFIYEEKPSLFDILNYETF